MASSVLKEFAPIEGVHFLGGKTLRGDILSRPPLSCANCGAKEAKNRCANCFSYAYCSKDCQVKHWPDHKTPCKNIKAFLDLEAAVMALCGTPFILHHLRAGIAIALDLVDPDPDENQRHRDECRVVPIKLTVHPLKEADTLAFALGKRTIQGKGPDSKIPGFIALHAMENDELVRSVDLSEVVQPETTGGAPTSDDDLDKTPTKTSERERRAPISGSKLPMTEADKVDQRRYRALWKQVRDQRAEERAARPARQPAVEQEGLEAEGEGEGGQKSEYKYSLDYEFDPDPIVLVEFEYETDRCTIALEITPDALETALCERLSDENEKLLEKLGVDLPEEWELFDMIVMINAFILADNADELKLRRILKRSDAEFLKDYMLTRAGK